MAVITLPLATSCGGKGKSGGAGPDAGAADTPDGGGGGGGDGGGGGGGQGIDTDGLSGEEEAAVTACIAGLPDNLKASADLLIEKGLTDQSSCDSPIGLTSDQIADDCSLSTFELHGDQSILQLHALVLEAHPDHLCHEITAALGQVWFKDHRDEAAASYHADFGGSGADRCYACPPAGGCQARDVISPSATPRALERARIDMAETIAATLGGDSWPYASVSWESDAGSACTSSSRTDWVQSAIAGGTASSLSIVGLDTGAICGTSAESVRVSFSADAAGEALLIRSVAHLSPDEGAQFYAPSSPTQPGETRGRTLGWNGGYTERVTLWAEGAFTARVSRCGCPSGDVDYDGTGSTPVCP
jgi:hypothetical protein